MRVARAPSYIVELGSGSGKLAFHMARALEELQHTPLRRMLGGRRVVVVLTDFCLANVDAWRQHPRLAELAARGSVDFAVFDAATPESTTPAELQLLESKVAYGATCTVVLLPGRCLNLGFVTARTRRRRCRQQRCTTRS